MKTTDFIKESTLVIAADIMEKDSEVQLARQDCHAIAKGAIELYHILKDLPEMTDLDNQCVANLNMAAKYIQESLDYFAAITQPAAGAFTFENAEAMYADMLNEAADHNVGDRVSYVLNGKRATSTIMQFDNGVAYMSNGDMVPYKNIFDQPIAEDATAGACASGSVAAVVSGLGEKSGQKNLLKRQTATTNVLTPSKNVKVKGGY